MNELSTTASRQEACNLVLNGLESLREGLIKYHELGLTTKEIYADLKAAGWDKSIRTLERHQTELRKEGLIAASSMAREQIAPKSERKSIAAKSGDKSDRNSIKPVENSTPQTPTFIHQNDDCISESVQQQHASIPVSNPVSVSQPNSNTYGDGCSEGVVSMGIASERDSYEGFKRIESLIDEITELHRRYFHGGISEFHWQDLSQQYDSLKIFADIRWQRHRTELERGREEFDRQLDKALKSREQSSSSNQQLNQS